MQGDQQVCRGLLLKTEFVSDAASPELSLLHGCLGGALRFWLGLR